MNAKTNVHYDGDLELFQAFLDPYMKYTAARFAPGEDDLDRAAVRMLDHTLAAGALHEGARVLEIGSGWGSLRRRMREIAPPVRYTAVNPSAEQQRYLAEHVDPGAELVVASFEDAAASLPGGYDTIFMVGCLCHLSDKERALARVAELLAPDGRVVLEDTFFLSDGLFRAHHDRPETRFVQQDIFGFAHIQPLGRHLDVVRGAGLVVAQTEDVSFDYARTIDAWTARLARLDPERFPQAADFIRYLAIAQRGWGYTITEHLMTLKKARRWEPRRPAS